MQGLVGQLPPGMQANVSQDLTQLNSAVVSFGKAAAQNNISGMQVAEAQTQEVLTQLQNDLNS